MPVSSWTSRASTPSRREIVAHEVDQLQVGAEALGVEADQALEQLPRRRSCREHRRRGSRPVIAARRSHGGHWSPGGRRVHLRRMAPFVAWIACRCDALRSVLLACLLLALPACRRRGRRPDRARSRRPSSASRPRCRPRPAPPTRWAASAAAPAWSSTAAGLVLTIGYLILEATAVDLYAADGKRGPGRDRRLRPRERLRPGARQPSRWTRTAAARPQQRRRGRRAAARAQPRRRSLGGREAKLASRREFAGYWEYLLPDALFTTPPHAEFAGAALIDRERAPGRHRLAARRRRHAPKASNRPATCSCRSMRCSRSWAISWRSATATRPADPGSASRRRSMAAS